MLSLLDILLYCKSIEEETSSDPSMFITELVLDTKALTFDPSEDHFQVSLQILNCCWYFYVTYVLSAGCQYRRAFQRPLAR